MKKRTTVCKNTKAQIDKARDLYVKNPKMPQGEIAMQCGIKITTLRAYIRDRGWYAARKEYAGGPQLAVLKEALEIDRQNAAAIYLREAKALSRLLNDCMRVPRQTELEAAQGRVKAAKQTLKDLGSPVDSTK